MKNVTAATVSKNSIVMVVDGHTTTIANSHDNYDEIQRLAAAGNFNAIAPLLDLVKAVVDFGKGRVTVTDGEILFDGKPTHNAVTTRIKQMIDEGLEVGPMIKFLENLMDNPSFRSVQQLYGFLEVNDLPITDDGCFLAYRMCREDWTDNRTGTMDNSLGTTVSMNRNEVNEDPDVTCSNGLHVCAQGYLGFYGGGGRTLLVKVNPRDVVAVPTDYKNAKMRVCEFTVVQEVDSNTRGNVYTSAVYDTAKVAESTLANADKVMTKDEAMAFYDCNAGALRKRCARGVTAKVVLINGEEMIQDIPTPDATKDKEIMSFDDALVHFGYNKAALVKRLNRASTAKRTYVAGVEMVELLAKD